MKKIHIIALVLIAGAFAAILAMTFKYSSYSDFQTASDHEGKEYQIKGTYVKERGLEYDENLSVNLFSFHMQDAKGNVSKVVVNDDVPRDFELTDEIVVIGKMNDGVFYARDMLTKCPSKYTEEDIAAS